ncbi:MAG: lantibiotic dehydratase [Kofleriaceae bacterium]
MRAPATVGAARELAILEDRTREERIRAISALERGPASKPVNRAIKALRRDETPAPIEGDGAPLIESVRIADAAQLQGRALAEQSLERESRAIAQTILDHAAEPRFREALIWQNRGALHGSVAGLLRRPADAMDSKTREQRRLVASYLQRYCVKNDTIGFFGPVGWARISKTGPTIAVTPGPTLLADRNVYFEYWAIDALAQTLASDPELRVHAKPRRMPSVRVVGTTLHHPNGKRIELPAAIAELLGALDGSATAHELAHARVGGDFETAADVYHMLAELEQRKLCSWTFELPTETFHPERALADHLAKASGPARERAEQQLAQLETGRAAVASSAGDPDALDRALHALETTFEELTSTSASRRRGETYAGRMLVFEDCRRDLDLELGRELLDRIGPALALVLASARWYTYAIASRYHRVLRDVCEELRRSHGPGFDYLRLHERLPALFPGSRASGIVREVISELHAHWESILAIGDARVIERRSADLCDAAAAAFRAPAPGWPSARHHSPDLLIAAADVDAIRRGDYRVVLGELHVGFNTIMPCLAKEHPDPAVLVRARAADLPDPGIAQVWSKARNRADFFSVSPHDLDLESGETQSGRARDHVVTSGELVVDDLGGEFCVCTRDGRYAFPLVAFLERHLIAESYAGFGLLGGDRTHTPRVVIDDLVVQRETWILAADTAQLPDDELARFVAAQRFAARHDMPRMVYVKTDTETKPFFVDFDSPILVDIFARNVKRASRVVVSEMSPSLDECWLPDAHGRHFTSELRLVATDPLSWRPICAPEDTRSAR